MQRQGRGTFAPANCHSTTVTWFQLLHHMSEAIVAVYCRLSRKARRAATHTAEREPVSPRVRGENASRPGVVRWLWPLRLSVGRAGVGSDLDGSRPARGAGAGWSPRHIK